MISASHLIVLYICVKFHENIELTQVHSRNVFFFFQYLLCHIHVVLYICVKFCENISDSIRVMKWT